MVRPLVIGCLLLVSFSTSRAQWGGMGDEQKSAQSMVAPGPRVVFDLLGFKQSGASPLADSTRMDLYLAVDYNSLEFLYAIDKYVADYSVTLQIMRHGDLVLDRYEAYSILESATEHHARVQHNQNAPPTMPSPMMRQADAQQISFLLPPGMGYSLRLSVQDHASRNTFDTSLDFNVKDFALSSSAMSDLLIFRDRQGRSIIPSIGPDVSSLTERINYKFSNEMATVSSGLFAELYNMPADSTLGVVTEITQSSGGGHTLNSAARGALISRATTTLHIPPVSGTMSTAPASPTMLPTSLVSPLFAPVFFDGLWTGYYTLHTYILPSAQDTALNDPSALETRAITSATRQILVTIAQGIPISVGDLDRAIEQLGVIATGSEWDSLSSAHTPKQKRDAILDFWQKKNSSSSALRRDDQNRAMEVFYSRVEYANAHFGTTFQAGWKSDRGHVYIALGPPDLIDSHPQGYAQAYGGLQAPYEVWQYSAMNTRYTFVDEYMLGDFRLRGAFPPEGTFMWQ